MTVIGCHQETEIIVRYNRFVSEIWWRSGVKPPWRDLCSKGRAPRTAWKRAKSSQMTGPESNTKPTPQFRPPPTPSATGLAYKNFRFLRSPLDALPFHVPTIDRKIVNKLRKAACGADDVNYYVSQQSIRLYPRCVYCDCVTDDFRITRHRERHYDRLFRRVASCR